MTMEIKWKCNCKICQYFRLLNEVMDKIEQIGEINAEYFDEPITDLFNLCDDNLPRFTTEHEKEISAIHNQS